MVNSLTCQMTLTKSLFMGIMAIYEGAGPGAIPTYAHLSIVDEHQYDIMYDKLP